MPGYLIELLSLILLLGIASMFILPELVSSLLVKPIINTKRRRDGLEIDKSNTRLLAESACWILSLALVLIALHFLYGYTLIQLIQHPLGITAIAMGLFMSIFRIYELRITDVRSRLIRDIEQRHSLPLGQILLNAKIITERQLHAALSYQAKEHLPLGQVLIKKRIINASVLDQYLKVQSDLRESAKQAGLNDQVPPVGKLMLEIGIVTRKQVNAALAQQRLYGGTLGEHLVAARCIDESELSILRSIQQAFDANQFTAARIADIIQVVIRELAAPCVDLLVRCGLITQGQLEIAQAQQLETEESIEDVLISRLFCTQELIDAVVNIQTLARETTSAERNNAAQ